MQYIVLSINCVTISCIGNIEFLFLHIHASLYIILFQITMYLKKPKVNNVRNLLESPLHIQWLEKTQEEITPIQKELKQLLPLAKLERKSFKCQFKAKKEIKRICDEHSKTKQPNIYREHLAPGFQSVIRGLEKKEICCVILDQNITPVLIQKVVFAYTQASTVPLIVMPELKVITKSSLGFATMVLGFKSIVAESPDNTFHSIYRLVAQNPTTFENALIVKTEDDLALEENAVVKSSMISKCKSKRLYLYREQINERVFVPKTKHKNKLDLNSSKQNIENFISLEKAHQSSSKTVTEVKKFTFKNSCDNSDDDDRNSDEDIDFFVDKTADKSLLEVEESRSTNVLTSQNKMFLDQKTNVMEKSQKVKHRHRLQFTKLQNKQQSKKDYVNKTRDPNQMCSVSFKPLHIKKITSNGKRKKKKKCANIKQCL